MPSTHPKSTKPRWVVTVLIAALISFVLLDLLILVTGTRVLAQALQPVASTATAGQWMCRYFDGTGFVLVQIHVEPGRAPECPLVLPSGSQ